MRRVFGLLSCVLVLLGCDERSPLATPPGVLLDVGPAALGYSGGDVVGGDRPTTERIALCAVQGPDGDRLFSLNVTGRTVGSRLVGVRVSAPASDCVVDARLAEAQTQAPAEDVPAVARISVTYRCPQYRGAGFIEVAALTPPTSQSFGFRCSPGQTGEGAR
jgi:hypothetical protein